MTTRIFGPLSIKFRAVSATPPPPHPATHSGEKNKEQNEEGIFQVVAQFSSTPLFAAYLNLNLKTSNSIFCTTDQGSEDSPLLCDLK